MPGTWCCVSVTRKVTGHEPVVAKRRPILAQLFKAGTSAASRRRTNSHGWKTSRVIGTRIMGQDFVQFSINETCPPCPLNVFSETRKVTGHEPVVAKRRPILAQPFKAGTSSCRTAACRRRRSSHGWETSRVIGTRKMGQESVPFSINERCPPVLFMAWLNECNPALKGWATIGRRYATKRGPSFSYPSRRLRLGGKRTRQSFTAKPKALARPQGEIAAAERIRAAIPAVAYGSAVNECGGERMRR